MGRHGASIGLPAGCFTAMKKTLLFSMAAALTGAFAAEDVQVFVRSVPGKPFVSVNEKWLRNALEVKPDVTVMLFGTNDACNSKVLSSQEAFLKTLDLAVKEIQGAQSRLILVTIPPCSEACLFRRHGKEVFGEKLPNERILNFNAILKQTADSKKLPLADLHAVVMKRGCEGKRSLLRLPENSGVADGIHLTEEGYAALAECVADTIRQAGYLPKKILCIGDSLTYGVGSRDAGKISGTTYPGQLKKYLTAANGKDETK